MTRLGDAQAAARRVADGLGYDVAGALAKVDLKPIPVGGGLPAGPERDDRARRLGAAFLLDGRVQSDGGDLRLSVGLADVRDHVVLWWGRFARPAAQSKDLQEQVALKVADVIRCAFDIGGSPGGGRADRETVGLYLRGCDLLRDADAQDRVLDIWRKVAERRPRFARVWSNLAMGDVQAAGSLPPDEAAGALKEARASAEHALRLDPKDAMAYVALAALADGPGRWAEREALIRKGLFYARHEVWATGVLDNSKAHLLSEVGRLSEAVDFAQRSVTLDPLSPRKRVALYGMLAAAGRIEEARAAVEAALRLWPDNDELRGSHIALEARLGDPDRALALLDDPQARPPDWTAARLDGWRRLVRLRKAPDPGARAAFARDQLADLAAGRIDADRAFLALTTVGAVDAAFAAAARAKPGDPLDSEGLFRPQAAGLRRDSRFLPLAAKLGLIDVWRASGKWPDFCQAPDRPYDCRAVAAKLAAAR